MGTEVNTIAPPQIARRNAKDPYFDPVRDRRMSELTAAQQMDAYELWLIQQLGTMQEYYQGHLAFLLDRIAGLRSELQQATTHLAAVTRLGEFAAWMDTSEPEMPLAAAKDWAEASEWATRKLGLPERVRVSKAEEDPTHHFQPREGGQFHCRRCRGSAASLPTECPGAPMSSDVELAVQHGRVDYVDSTWVFKRSAVGSGTASAVHQQGPVVAPLQKISYVLRDAMSLYPGSRETPDYAVEVALWLDAHEKNEPAQTVVQPEASA